MALREVLANFTMNVDDKDLKKANKGIGNFKKAALGAAAAIGGAFAVGKIVSGLRDVVTEADNLAKTAAKLNLPAEQLQALQFAARRSGVENEVLTKGFQTLAKSASEAGEGVATYKDEFDKLGITTTTQDGQLKDLNTLFLESARALGGLENSTQKLAIAQVIFGRAGKELIPLFDSGQKGIDGLLKRYEELGGGLSGEFLKNAEGASDAIEDLRVVKTGLRSELASAFLPVIRDVASALGTFLGFIRRNDTAMAVFKVTMFAFTAALTALTIAMALNTAGLGSWNAAIGRAALSLGRFVAGPLLRFGRFLISGPAIAGAMLIAMVDLFRFIGGGANTATEQLLPKIEKMGVLGGFIAENFRAAKDIVDNFSGNLRFLTSDIRSFGRAVSETPGIKQLIDAGDFIGRTLAGPAAGGELATARGLAPSGGGGGSRSFQGGNVTQNFNNPGASAQDIARAVRQENQRQVRDAERALGP